MKINNPFKKYIPAFSVAGLWDKLKKYAKQAGIKAVYMVLLLYFAYTRKETPSWAKNIILGTLGYFLAPIDALPDLTPIIGYTDDIGVLSFGLVTIAAHINEEVRNRAKVKLKNWFGEYDSEELVEIDKQF